MGESRESVVERLRDGPYLVLSTDERYRVILWTELEALLAVVEAAQAIDKAMTPSRPDPGSPLGRLRAALAALTTEQKPVDKTYPTDAQPEPGVVDKLEEQERG